MEKSEQIKNLRLLAEMLEGRDKTYLEYTRAILDLLAPTLLGSIVEFFGIQENQIEWHEVKPHGATIILLATIYLDPADQELLGDEFDGDTKKIVRIAIPAQIAFESNHVITEWLERQEIQSVDKETVLSKLTTDGEYNEEDSIEDDDDEDDFERFEAPEEEPEKPDVPPAPVQSEFDPGSLSKDQIAQLLYFQHHTKGTKQ